MHARTRTHPHSNAGIHKQAHAHRHTRAHTHACTDAPHRLAVRRPAPSIVYHDRCGKGCCDWDTKKPAKKGHLHFTSKEDAATARALWEAMTKTQKEASKGHVVMSSAPTITPMTADVSTAAEAVGMGCLPAATGTQ